MVEENVGSESIDQSNLPTTTNISTDDSNLLAKPKAIDIYSRVVGNPLVGSNPGEKNPYVSNEAYTDSLAEKIRNNALSTTNKYGNLQPYTYNGDIESVNFDRYYSSKPFKTYGFSPYRDNESLYNDKMTFGDQFVRAASQWDNLVATGFTSGVRAWKTMFTDPLAPDIQGAREMKKIMSVGASNTGGFGGFITNTFLNSGYTIGIMADLIAEEVALAGVTAFSGGLAGEVTAPGMAAKAGLAARRLAGFGEATKNIKTGTRVTELAKESNEALNAIRNTESSVNNWRNFYTGAVKGTVDLLNPLENTLKAVRNVDYATDYAKISKTTGAFIEDMIQLKSAVSEAKLEGGMVKLDVNQNLINEYKLTHNGEEPTGKDLQYIENLSNQEALRTAFWNLPAIVTSNKLLFGAISKPLDKVLGKSTTKLLNNQVLENGVFKVAGEGTKNNLKNVVRGLKNPKVYGSAARDYLKVNFAEGVQENIQEAISTGAINHAMDVYKDPLRAGYEGYMGHFMNGLKEQFSAQGAETFAGGFVMGMFVQPILAGPAIGISKIGKLFNNKEAVKAAKEARDQQLNKETESLNELYQNPLNYFAPNVINAVKNGRVAANVTEASENNNKKEVADNIAELKSNHIMTALKTGNYDAFISKLQDYKNMSVDEAAEAFKQYGLEKEDAGKVLGKIDEIIADAKQIKKNYEEVADTYPNPFDPQQYPPNSTKQKAAFQSYKAWEEAQETLVFSKNLFDNYNERVAKMANTFSGISSAIGKTDAQKFMVLLDPNETKMELEILKAEIKSLDETDPEQKKLKARKQKTRDTLLEFSKVMSSIKDAHAAKDTLENIEKLHIDSKKIFNDYVNQISDKNNTIVFDTQVNEAYELIKDSHLMKNEMKGIAKTINVLNNPKGFLNLQERLTIAYGLIIKEANEILENNKKLFVNVETRNDAINIISKKTGLTIPADYILAFNDADENDKPLPVPTYFIDPITGDSVINGDKFDEAKALWAIYTELVQKEVKPTVTEEKTPESKVEEFDSTNLATFPKDLVDTLQFNLDELKGNGEINENATLKEYIESSLQAQNLIKNYAKSLKSQIITGADLTYKEYLEFPIEDLQEQLNELYKEVLIKPELISKIYDIEQALRFLRLQELSSTITIQQADAIIKLEEATSKIDKNGDFYELNGEKLDTRVTKIVDEILNKEYGLKSYNFADEQGAEISKVYETLLKAPHNKTATVKELLDELKEKGKSIEEFQLRFNTSKLNKIQEGLEKDRSLENFKVLLNEYAYKETSIRGNTIDELGRKFLSGEELKKTDKITDSAFKDLFKILVEFKKSIKNEIIVARNLRINGTTTDSKTFGGEMDILVITPEGKFKIYDMKTAGNWSNFGTKEDNYNKKEKYGLQLSIYKNALENLTGITVDEIELLPIQTKEDLDGNITSVKKVNNPAVKKLDYADYKEVVEKYVPSKMDTVTPVSTDAKSDIERRRQEELDKTNTQIERVEKGDDSVIRTKVEIYTTLGDSETLDEVVIITFKDGSRIFRSIDVKTGELVLNEKIKKENTTTNEKLIEAFVGNLDNSLKKISEDNNPNKTIIDKINAKYDAELAALDKRPKTNEQKIEELRAQEQADLVKAGINLADFEDTYGENKGNMPDDLYAVYKPIYDKYNVLITDLSDSKPETQTVEQFNQLSTPEKFAIITKELEDGKVLIGTYYQANSVADRKDSYKGIPDNLTQEVRLADGRILQASQYNNNIITAKRVNIKLVQKLINGKLTKTLEVSTNGKPFTVIRENPIKWNVKTETSPVVKDLSIGEINNDINLDSLAISKDKNYEVVYESVTKPEDNGRYMIENVSKNSVTLTGLSKTIVVKTDEIKDNIKEVVDNKIIPSSPVEKETITDNIETVKKNDVVIDDSLTDMEQALKMINDKLC